MLQTQLVTLLTDFQNGKGKAVQSQSPLFESIPKKYTAEIVLHAPQPVVKEQLDPTELFRRLSQAGRPVRQPS